MITKPAGHVRIVSLNLNGIRSATDKGVIAWMEQSDADIICLQETRIDPPKWLPAHQPTLWHCHLFAAHKPGYAGTAIYSRLPMRNISNGLGFAECDTQGRYCQAEFSKADGSTFTVASVYFPSGSSGDEAQARKEVFLGHMETLTQQWADNGKSIILCGDVNIAHREIDIKNAKGNAKNSGFLPHERAWIDRLLERGYIDAFRQVNANKDEYSWWSNRGQAYANNVGWRIDYQFASADWQAGIGQAFIYRSSKFSDHAPVIVDYAL
jgi:exodeoxyribonuclease-3